VTGSTGTRAERAAATAIQLLDATAEILRSGGAGAVSVQRVADEAGVSKGLVHYHFDGKEALLAHCAERLSRLLVEAEQVALDTSSPGSALDDLSMVVSGQPHVGRRRALLALALDSSPQTSAAYSAASVLRRESSLKTVARLEELLGFEPRIPRAALAEAYLALVDGLAMDHGVRPDSHVHHRQAFDAFWLAVLSVGER